MLNDSSKNKKEYILVTGVTGYVGGRLVPRLLEAGYRVRCMVRDKTRLEGRPWFDDVDVVEADVLKRETLIPALAGIDVAYYLIHSMTSDASDFHSRDLLAARQFGQAAEDAQVKRIIYLGGLGDPDADLSKHLRSRQETGKALGEFGVPVTEFRAAVIVGSGSLSFEMIRYLSERLPVMICPRWVATRTQPIAIRNVLDYLVGALSVPESAGQVVEVGGADVLTYGKMIKTYAQVRGLRRWLISVPVLTPALSSYWVHWVTPISANIIGPLIAGLRNEVVVRDDKAKSMFPKIKPVSYREAVELALTRLQVGDIESAWTDALATSRGDVPPVVLKNDQGMIVERRQAVVEACPEKIFRVVTGMGGKRGWFFANWTWEIRGLLDRAIGGVGLRRGRRDPDVVRVGDALDFWRVEAVESARLMRLRAEMKVPGRAWLQFEIKSLENQKAQLFQTAFFAPKGVWGLLYWYVLYPVHALIFSGMIRQIVLRAEKMDDQNEDK
jgi:uncharacterized protein YbjT (DUF2867 family)